MNNVRQAAAASFIRSKSIPLLAITNESFYHGKLSWTLRFPVPPPVTFSSARRFSSTLTFQQGSHGAKTLDGALRLAVSFSFNNDASHVLSTPLFYVSLISQSFAFHVLNPMKLRLRLNPRYKIGSTTVHSASSLTVIVNISQSL